MQCPATAGDGSSRSFAHDRLEDSLSAEPCKPEDRDTHSAGKTISKAPSASSPKVRMASMSRRIAVSTSSVVQLPNRIHIAFGGAPLSVAKQPKSLSF